MASATKRSLISIVRRGFDCMKVNASSSQRNFCSVVAKNPTRGSLTLKNVATSSSMNTTTQWNSKKFYSSSVDEEMRSVLDKEIELETQQTKAVKNIPGWNTATDGSNVTLSKMHGAEKISVTFSVNDSITPTYSGYSEDGGEQDPSEASQVCCPPFDVDIEKRSGKKLRLVCEFTQEQILQDGGQQDIEDDLFGIAEVQFIEGEEKEKDYFLSGESMDADMYRIFMDMLHERGVNEDFIQELLDFCMAYEQQQYTGLLKKLQAFMKE